MPRNHMRFSRPLFAFCVLFSQGCASSTTRLAAGPSADLFSSSVENAPALRGVRSVYVNRPEVAATAGAPDLDLLREKAVAAARATLGIPIASDRSSADAILSIMLDSFREREGSPYGAMAPAAVSARYSLADARTGRVLWRAEYAERDKSLAENMWQIGEKFREGFGWKSAGYLFEKATSTALSELRKEVREG